MFRPGGSTFNRSRATSRSLNYGRAINVFHLFSELRLRGVTLLNRIGVFSDVPIFTVRTVLPVIGTSPIWPRARSAAPAWFSPKRRRSRPKGGSPRRILASGATNTSNRSERIARFIKGQGGVAGVQLAHAGRKASAYRPCSGQGSIPVSEGGWRTIAPSPLSFGKGFAAPEELTVDRILALKQAFTTAAKRAPYRGVPGAVEVHAAHGYQSSASFSLRSAIAGPTPMAGRSTTARGSCTSVWGPFEAPCPITCPLFVRISADRLDGRRLGSQAVDRAFAKA